MAEIDTGDEELGKARLHLEEARWRRDDQATRQEGLNRRLNTLFALNFAVLAVLGVYLRFSDLALPPTVEYMVYSTVFVLVSNLALLLWTYRIGKGSRRPDLRRLHELTQSRYDLTTLTHWTAIELGLAIDANEQRASAKAKWVTRTMWTSALAVLLVALVVVLALWFASSIG